MVVVALIAAAGDNGVIGRNNQLPWRLPADMQYFRRMTMGKPIVMGRKTFESFGAKPLPGRHNIVLTRDASYKADGATVVGSLAAALTAAGEASEIMIIGGSELYMQALPMADRIYLTRVHGEFEGDAFFPTVEPTIWNEVSREDHEPDEKNPCAYSFLVLERKTTVGINQGSSHGRQ